MTKEEKGKSRRAPDPQAGSYTPAPNGLIWPFKRFYWTLEKYVLWPVADSFKWAGRGIGSAFNWLTHGLRYRSPFAYVGATLAFAITAFAVGAAFYFHNESKSTDTPVVATVTEGDADSAVLPPTTTAPDTSTTVTPTGAANDGNTLKGVAPSFQTTGDSTGSDSTGSSDKKDPTLVKPADAPKSGPLKVANNFANTFVSYEVGKKGAAKKFKKTATKELAKVLAADPPRQPANGTVPEATVLNVVKGPKEGGKLGVSVALLRLGTSSELRLSLEQAGKGKDKQWLVSEVLG